MTAWQEQPGPTVGEQVAFTGAVVALIVVTGAAHLARWAVTTHPGRFTLAAAVGATAGLVWAERDTRPYRRPTACPRKGPHVHPLGGRP